MAKKYLNLEEAAAAAGVSIDDLKNLRENGKIRGFADRGTWKFKSEDIEEFVRSQQADSDPEVPLFDEDLDAGGSSLVLGSDESGAGSSVIVDEGSSVMKTSEDALGEQATVIRGNVQDVSPPGTTSDSDVRLILDDSLTAADSEGDVDILGDSDSDVRLVEDSEPALVVEGGSDSDSDVQLIAPEDSSDSDVQLVGLPEADSDSDVELVDSDSPTDRDVKLAGVSPGPRSDSDVRLVDSGMLRSDSDVKLVPSSSGVTLEDSAILVDESTAGEGSSIVSAAAGTDDSSITLPSAGSGIALQRADSGIALEGLDDSGISLSDDSIRLAGDSGIALGKPIDSGLALDEGSEDELHATVPMLKTGGLEVSDGTDLEVPALDDDSEFELEGGDGGSGETDTSVILFDDDDFDDRAATVVKKKGPAALDEDFEGETLDFTESEEFSEELEVSDDVVGEDDELDELDVFDAGDEDFEGGFETGESHAEFVAPAGRIAVPVEQEWGVGTFVGLVVCTLLLLICGTMIFDLVRYMWRPAGEDQIGPFLNIFKDLI
jgi:Helix-turn-helix domain